MPAGIRERGVENPQGFGMMNADLKRGKNHTAKFAKNAKIIVALLCALRVLCGD